MKHLLLFIGLLMSTVSIQAQGDFAPVGAEWYYSNSHIDNPTEQGYTYMKVEKDTLIASQDCRKIIRWKYRAAGVPLGTTVDTSALAPVYVYSNPDTVFYYNDTFSRFLPLYIFNIPAGDSIAYHVPYLPAADAPGDTLFYMNVSEVSTLILDGISLIRVSNMEPMMSNSSRTWGYEMNVANDYVERLGSLYGFMHTEATFLAGHNVGFLRCYQDETINYQWEQPYACDYIPGYTGISELAQQYNNLRLYPNPVQDDWLQIELNKSPGRELQVQMYSINGARVTTMESTGNTQAVRLYVGDLPPGIYQIQVNTEGKVVGKGRFVKR